MQSSARRIEKIHPSFIRRPPSGRNRDASWSRARVWRGAWVCLQQLACAFHPRECKYAGQDFHDAPAPAQRQARSCSSWLLVARSRLVARRPLTTSPKGLPRKPAKGDAQARRRPEEERRKADAHARKARHDWQKVDEAEMLARARAEAEQRRIEMMRTRAECRAHRPAAHGRRRGEAGGGALARTEEEARAVEAARQAEAARKAEEEPPSRAKLAKLKKRLARPRHCARRSIAKSGGGAPHRGGSRRRRGTPSG